MKITPECIWQAQATLGEGPIWSVKKQALYWVDILDRRLHRYTPFSDERRTWKFDEEVSSLAERKEVDSLILTTRHGFAFFDPVTEKLEHIIEPESHLPNNRFNDGKCDALGRYWAGSVEYGCTEPVGSLYRLTPDLHCEKMDCNYAVTNGPTWSSDWKTMYFNDSHLGHVYAFDFDLESGMISNKRLFLAFDPEDGSPDGMTTDSEGCLWIAHWGPGKVTRRDTQGKVMQTIAFPCNHVSSCTFGGPEFKTLYVTSARVGLSEDELQRQPLAGSLFAVALDVAGVPANRFAG